MAVKKRKKYLLIFQKKYFLSIFVFFCLFVGVVLIYKALFANPTYIYAKVKVGQGLWWAVTTRPPIWYVEAIKKGDTSLDLLGRTEAKILSKKFYRWYAYDQYDVYIDLQLNASFNEKTKEYNFNRSILSVGSPIELQFPSENITGTVIALSTKPFNDKFIYKTIQLTKKYASTWEYDSIHVGDQSFDGEGVFFEVLEKSTTPSTGLSYSNIYSSNVGASVLEPSNYVTVKAKIKLKQVGEQWVLGEDQIVSAGRSLNISTPNFVFDNYFVTSIE